MSRRELTGRAVRAAAAVVCLAAAVALALLAVDIDRWRSTIAPDDLRYRVAPGEQALWRPDQIVLFDAARTLLGVDDDVAFREAVRALRLSRISDPTASMSDPTLAIRRSDAQARLEAIVNGGGSAARRSRAAGLLGVLGLSRLVSETEDRPALF